VDCPTLPTTIVGRALELSCHGAISEADGGIITCTAMDLTMRWENRNKKILFSRRLVAVVLGHLVILSILRQLSKTRVAHLAHLASFSSNAADALPAIFWLHRVFLFSMRIRE
jgi:hypothetical protein